MPFTEYSTTTHPFEYKFINFVENSHKLTLMKLNCNACERYTIQLVFQAFNTPRVCCQIKWPFDGT